ncbi:MAG TPA: ATP-binding cassette domain-containing protein, partial [Acidimicrobiales bacterium]
MLRVEGIDVSYGPVQALRGVSLQVDEGELVALLGANGAGKTTTLRAVSGMVPVTAGSVTFGGTTLSNLPPHQVVRAGLAHVPEGRELFGQLSV